ncbi:hypothetical protein HUJ04_011698, partial [Dendroctonus ponderosae]
TTICKLQTCDEHLSISTEKYAIFKHGLSAFHVKKVRSIAKQSTLTKFTKPGLSSNFNVEKHVKEVMYHLVKVITKIPRLEGWTCGRTKTTAIVKNVLGQHSFEDSCSELLQVTTFVWKQGYISDNKICDSLLALIKICEADAITLHRHIF